MVDGYVVLFLSISRTLITRDSNSRLCAADKDVVDGNVYCEVIEVLAWVLAPFTLEI